MLVLVCLFEHLPAGILCLCAVICMAVQSTPNSQIPECKLFSTQCKAYIVQNLCDFLPLPVAVHSKAWRQWPARQRCLFLSQISSCLELKPGCLMDSINRLPGNTARTLCASELSRSSGSRGWHVKIKANYKDWHC